METQNPENQKNSGIERKWEFEKLESDKIKKEVERTEKKTEIGDQSDQKDIQKGQIKKNGSKKSEDAK